MPRYARYKRYYRKVYPRKRWASNIKTFSQLVNISPSSTSNTTSFVVCRNSQSDVTPTPIVLKFGRFRMKGDIRTSAPNAERVTSVNVFVAFVPEGAVIDSTFITKHPEYVLGWTTLSMDTGNSFSLTSTLKRNLNSGDSIQILFTIDTSVSPTDVAGFNIYFTIQFWTATS